MPFEFQVSLHRNQLFPVALPEGQMLEHGQLILVETEDGQETGKVTRIPKLAQFAWEKDSAPKAVRFLRIINTEDKAQLADKKVEELKAYQHCKNLIEKHHLPMSLVSVYYTFDRAKLTFYYTAPQRVDFRELLRDLTQLFRRVRINLRHIGPRDETALLGGIGPCGQELCCTTFLRDFKPVNVTLAREQNLPLNPAKVTGNCGRLMCCLNYEYEMYLEAVQKMPVIGTSVQTVSGQGRITGLHFLKEEVTVRFEDGNHQTFPFQSIRTLENILNTPATHSLEKPLSPELLEIAD